jgi:uncharacterized membrane protein YqgA involved in biofilm formation
LGLLIGSKLSEQFKEVVFASAGLVTLVIGIKMALETGSFLILLFSMVLGGLIGYIIGIEKGILKAGSWIEKLSFRRNSNKETGETGSLFAVGFLISAGTVGDYNLIFIKSVMDGSMAIIFAAAYGPGVLASALSVLVYQGFFTIMGATISPLLKESGLNELSAVGGILLIMIACNLIGIKQFKTGNFLPALILAPAFAYLGAIIIASVPMLA